MCFLATTKVRILLYLYLEQVIKNICIYRNSWSDEGVSTNRVANSVECRTTHLTSFAVLVDTQGSSNNGDAEKVS